MNTLTEKIATKKSHLTLDELDKSELKVLIGAVSNEFDKTLLKKDENPDEIRSWYYGASFEKCRKLSSLDEYFDSFVEESASCNDTDSSRGKIEYEYELEKISNYKDALAKVLGPFSPPLFQGILEKSVVTEIPHCICCGGTDTCKDTCIICYLDVSTKTIKCSYVMINSDAVHGEMHYDYLFMTWTDPKIDGTFSVQHIILQNPNLITDLGEIFGYDVLLRFL